MSWTDGTDSMGDHRTNMIIHAVRKLWQRFGLTVNLPQYNVICDGIRADFYRLVAQDHRGQNVYEIAYRGKTFYAVWNAQHDCIRTFLPCREFIGQRHPRARPRDLARKVFGEARV